MPDPIFEDPRLAHIYDAFEGERPDLDHYLAIAKELEAISIVDVGCGTGSFACLLSERGYEVTALDPAKASVDVAKRKPHAERVQWILGDAVNLPPLAADLAFMTGNVAQVFLTDESWRENLLAIRRALRPGGHLVFEARDPARKAWENWRREPTYKRLCIPNIGWVEGWCDLISTAGGYIAFRWTYVFEASGNILLSDSTLRFREKNEIEDALKEAGYAIREVRDAPDRPGQEFVFVAKAL